MNSRETVRQALAHHTGRVPIDFGSTPVTGIHVSIVAALREHFGLNPGPVRIIEPYQMLGEVADDLLEALGADCVGAPARMSIFGFPLAGPGREWRCPWGQVVLVSDGFQTTAGPGGDIFIHPTGDVEAPASGHMPATGYFFDAIIRQESIDEDKLNPADNLEEFAPLSVEDVTYWKALVTKMKDSSRAVVANMGGTAFGDIALVPGPFLTKPKGIRDVSEWYVSLVARRNYVHAIFEQQCAIALGNLEQFHAIVGSAVDVLFVCGTDFGTQISQFCSTATFEELYQPYYSRLNDWIHRHTTWKTFKHSCGAIDPLLPGLIKSGFDIINPVQCSAAGMDAEHLKQAYGPDLVFWGGGVDTQHTLPFGTPEQVYAEVTGRCHIFSRQGGFVFNSIHNIQARTPLANILAMLDAVRDFNAAGG